MPRITAYYMGGPRRRLVKSLSVIQKKRNMWEDLMEIKNNFLHIKFWCMLGGLQCGVKQEGKKGIIRISEERKFERIQSVCG